MSVSNGLGAGFSTEQALTHALLELLQRDGNSVNYRALDQGVGVDLTGAALSPEVRELLERFAAYGIEVRVKLAATDFGLTNLYVVGAHAAGEVPGIMAAGAGEACHPDKSVALEKALLEYAAARTRLVFNHGPLAALTPIVPSGYLEAYREAFGTAPEEAHALAAMVGWLQRSPRLLRGELQRVYEVRHSVAWDDLLEVEAHPAGLLPDLVHRLANFDLLYSEFASPRAQSEGVRAVKAIVPTLEVETVSYGRIGVRNLRRRLARNSPLVGLGKPPAGAAPVRLTAQAEEELGDTAWFDFGAAGRLAEPLYSLYREPSRHAAPWRLETVSDGSGS